MTMRPYFFKRPTVAADKRAERFRQRQRDRVWAQGDGGSVSTVRRVARIIKALLAGKRQAEPWEKEIIAAAQAKRERRKERNLRRWVNDRTWRRT
jgi:hypothetical protein